MADSRTPRLRGVRSLAAFLALLMVAGCNPVDDLMVSIFGRSMRDQPSFNPYENPQLAPEGSVSFSSGNFPGEPHTVNLGSPEGQAPPPPITPLMLLQGDPRAVGLENPVAPDAASLARGQEMYLRSCAPCHGDAGAGGGPVTAFGVPNWSLQEDTALEFSDGYIYSIIRVGRGAMPAYGHQITHYDRWHIVNYVRQLQGELPGQEEPEVQAQSSDN
ncbi:MAG: cytochrome c [Gemmatimonadales bacterium]|nr:MAG: cytochrome c [Gemmatimonadales bacterium]